MNDVYYELKARGLKSKLVLQVHDELIIDAYKPELEEVKEILKDKMENAIELSVPLVVDIGVGNSGIMLNKHNYDCCTYLSISLYFI